MFTITDAANACGVSRNTVRRRLDAGAFPNAYKDAAGSWAIPVGDLEAAGLRPYRPSPAEDAAPVRPDGGTTTDALEELERLRAEAVEVRDRMAELARRADVAEAIATERAARIEDLKQAMRQLEASNPKPEERPAPAPSEPVRRPPRKRTWWDRILR